MEVFKQRVYMNVPNQEVATYLYLYGHAFAYQMYAMYDEPVIPFYDLASESTWVDGVK